MIRSIWWRVSPELFERFALERVQRGGVTKSRDCYLDHDCPVPDYLTEALDEAAQAGLVTLAEPAAGGRHRIVLTDAGRARYIHHGGVI